MILRSKRQSRNKTNHGQILDIDVSALSQPRLEAVEITRLCTGEDISNKTQEVDLATRRR